MKHSKLLSMVLLLLAAVAAGFWFGGTMTAEHRERLLLLEQENGKLQAAVEELRSLNATLRDKPAVDQAPAGKPSPATPFNKEFPYSNDIGTMSALRESLALANRTIEELRTRVSEEQAQTEQVRQDRERLTAIQADLTQQLASSKLLAEKSETELRRKDEQLTRFEKANRKLRDEAAVAGSKAAQALQTINELQEIYRRRESYVDGLMSRYREITEQYRAFASVLENRRGPEGTPGASMSIAGPELSRIQSSITMAEEDLRQLSTLDAQALRLQKKLSEIR